MQIYFKGFSNKDDIINLYCNVNKYVLIDIKQTLQNSIIIYAMFDYFNDIGYIIFEKEYKLYLVIADDPYDGYEYSWFPEQITEQELLMREYLDENAKYNIKNIDKIKKLVIFA